MVDFEIVLGVPDVYKELHEHGLYPGSCVHYSPYEIWLHLDEESEVIVTRNVYTGEIYTDTFMEWLFWSLAHEEVHLACHFIGENPHFHLLGRSSI